MAPTPNRKTSKRPPTGQKYTDDKWVTGTTFNFERQGSARKKKITASASVNKMSPTALKNRRQSILLKRLDLPADFVMTSPDRVRRKTRRMSMSQLPKGAATTTKGPMSRATSEKILKGKAAAQAGKTEIEIVPPPMHTIVRKSREVQKEEVLVTLQESPSSKRRKVNRPTPGTGRPAKLSPQVVSTTSTPSPTAKSFALQEKIIKKVRVTASSPLGSGASFRKTPRKNNKQTPIEAGTPEFHTPAESVLSSASRKAKEPVFTPRPEVVPSNVLRQDMKKRLAKEMQTLKVMAKKVDIDDLMDSDLVQVRVRGRARKQAPKGEQTPVQLDATFSNGVVKNVQQNARLEQVSTTPAGVSKTAQELPSTPKSSRKRIVMSSVTRSARSTRRAIRDSFAAEPRSSTPVENLAIGEPSVNGSFVMNAVALAEVSPAVEENAPVDNSSKRRCTIM